MNNVFRRRAVVAIALPFLFPAACSLDVGKLFDRPDPEVERARFALEASVSDGDADLVAARIALEEHLKFRCDAKGGRDLVVDRPFGSLDLGLVMFRLSELLGHRFGEEERDAGESQEIAAAARARELDCAQLLLGKLAGDPATPKDLAWKARYLLGNFAFLARRYREAVDHYDKVLLAHPARGSEPAEIGPPNDDDAVARAAAWNRAIALRRIDDQKDAGPDADSSDGQDSQPDNADTPDSSDATDSPDGDGADSGSDGADSSGDSGGTDGADGRNDGRDEAGSDGASDSADAKGGEDTGPDSGDADATADSAPGDAKNESGAEVSPDTSPPPAPAPSTSAPPRASVDPHELDRFRSRPPLDPDMPEKKRERRLLPKALDK